ncbi:MAG: alternative ribosome rescue aminoacyl-tRNA hydrolase ArfB [Longimicrobiales bacterium]
MSDDSILFIDEALSIPRAELSYQATRAGGPGGQHVNTSSTRVELIWNVRASAAVTEAQRERLMMKLARRIDKNGNLRMASGTRRSQYQNKEEVTDRFQRIVAAALVEEKPRKKTRPTRASREARLKEKQRRAETKQRRGRVREENGG